MQRNFIYLIYIIYVLISRALYRHKKYRYKLFPPDTNFFFSRLSYAYYHMVNVIRNRIRDEQRFSRSQIKNNRGTLSFDYSNKPCTTAIILKKLASQDFVRHVCATSWLIILYFLGRESINTNQAHVF